MQPEGLQIRCCRSNSGGCFVPFRFLSQTGTPISRLAPQCPAVIKDTLISSITILPKRGRRNQGKTKERQKKKE